LRLLQKSSATLSSNGSPLSELAPNPHAATTNMVLSPKILVVEDDDAIRALLVAALRREPFDVHAAVNGVEALELTRASEYAVILLDLMMPALNGVEFLQAFHEANPQSRTVVFVMTAFDDAMVRHLAPNLVHGIVRKPFDVPQLVAMVREVALIRMPQTPESEVETDTDVLESGEEAPAN
jgi:DNA-binding response OmpR family regulator